MWKGRLKRRKMGITNVGQKSEAEKKAAVFKNRFMSLLQDPSAHLASPRANVPGPNPLVPNTGEIANITTNPLVSPRAPAAPVPTMGPGPTSPHTAQASSPDISEVRNVFRERAAKRKEAREARGISGVTNI